MKKAKQECETCRFWQFDHLHGEASYGQCRRWTPVIARGEAMCLNSTQRYAHSKWPETGAWDSCGEWGRA